MRVHILRISHYRNFTSEEISFSSGTNVFVGRNGQGKTNLLEAIYILGYGKSFRTSNPRECIQHEGDECRVEGVTAAGGLERRLRVIISRESKTLFVHEKVTGIDEFVGNLHVLAFTTEHMGVVRGGPAERRAFVDRAMATLYPGHVRYLATYGRALRQRNQLLAVAREDRRKIDERILGSWDEVLIQDGVRILANRRRYVEQLKEQLPQGVFGSERLKLKYVSTIGGGGESSADLETSFRKELEAARSNDQERGYTTIGPHRDEIKLFLDGKSLADFGSSGQQRSSLLSLYFAQMEVHRRTHGFYPVFLTDDVEAELDDERLRAFIEFLAERTQTILTTAKPGVLPALGGEAQHFEIVGGSVRRGGAGKPRVQAAVQRL